VKVCWGPPLTPLASALALHQATAAPGSAPRGSTHPSASSTQLLGGLFVSALAGAAGPCEPPLHHAPPLPRSLQISTQGDSCVRYVSPLGTTLTVAGTGVGALTGDGGRATSASLWDPSISPYDDEHQAAGSSQTQTTSVVRPYAGEQGCPCVLRDSRYPLCASSPLQIRRLILATASQTATMTPVTVPDAIPVTHGHVYCGEAVDWSPASLGTYTSGNSGDGGEAAGGTMRSAPLATPIITHYCLSSRPRNQLQRYPPQG